MTIEDFLQTVVLVVCLLAGCVVLPVGMVTTSMSESPGAGGQAHRPVILFEDLSP